MCPEDYCGPLCLTRAQECAAVDGFEKYDFIVPNISFGIYNFKDPTNDECPDKCCYPSNEYCFRMYDNTGYMIETNQEIMLVFGGISQREVLINNKSIADDCDIPSDFAMPEDQKNLFKASYLINNCGYEIMNELWIYNINSNKWTYIKPFVDSNQPDLRQKPVPRYGHTSVYVEKMDTTITPNILRKYMFMYGGFSIYCNKICDDFWVYEIAYAPQRYYSRQEDSHKWNRGNVWNQIKTSNANTPGKRMFHSMIVDSKFDYLYLFGGMSVDYDGNYELKNDMWRYDINLNSWERINTMGISKVIRPITYWDGTTQNIFISPQEYDSSTDNYIFDSEDSKSSPILPKQSCAHSIEILKEDGQESIYIFGGYNWNTIKNYKIQNQLNDFWKYNIRQNTWIQIFPFTDEYPKARYGASLRWVESKKLLLFGGINSSGVLNDLWLFNINSNQWTDINTIINTEDDWPFPVKFSTILKYSKVIRLYVFIYQGIILYGGSFIVDGKIEKEYSLFSNRKRLIYILNDIYTINSNSCINNCSQRGICDHNSCLCDEGYYGTNCEYINCPNSFCYYDAEFWSSERCHHCSDHGTCNNGKCECIEGWLGDDCSIKDCPNKCSTNVDPNIGKCVLAKPVSQCECNQQFKRGGDDCSVIFCLNDCGENGKCDYNQGTCECKSGFFGSDCSVKVISFRNFNEIFRINVKLYFILLLFIIN